MPFKTCGSSVTMTAREVVVICDVRPRKIDLAAESLSGGNQQKVILAGEITRNPEVLVAMQPTRGLEVGKAFASLWLGTFRNLLSLTSTINRSSPLIFVVLAVAFAFRGSVFNIGAEGQLLMGAVFATLIGSRSPHSRASCLSP